MFITLFIHTFVIIMVMVAVGQAIASIAERKHKQEVK